MLPVDASVICSNFYLDLKGQLDVLYNGPRLKKCDNLRSEVPTCSSELERLCHKHQQVRAQERPCSLILSLWPDAQRPGRASFAPTSSPFSLGASNNVPNGRRMVASPKVNGAAASLPSLSLILEIGHVEDDKNNTRWYLDSMIILLRGGTHTSANQTAGRENFNLIGDKRYSRTALDHWEIIT